MQSQDPIDKIESTLEGHTLKHLEASFDQKLFINNLKLKKQRNVILANIPVSVTENKVDNNNEDLKKIYEVFESLKIELNKETVIKSFFRIKTEDPTKNYLKVILNDEFSRNLILKASNKLKVSTKPWVKEVFCFPDLTFDDRQLRKNLIVERNERNHLLGPDDPLWVIRNLKLVQKF